MNRILIVDDSRTWLVFHKNTIEQFYGNFFDITTANSAKEALNIIKRNCHNPFDIIITDLQMETDYEPQLAGEWLIEQIKSHNEYIRAHIIIISSMYNIEFIAKKYNTDCISKNILIRNDLLLKILFEKLMPNLSNLK